MQRSNVQLHHLTYSPLTVNSTHTAHAGPQPAHRIFYCNGTTTDITEQPDAVGATATPSPAHLPYSTPELLLQHPRPCGLMPGSRHALQLLQMAATALQGVQPADTSPDCCSCPGQPRAWLQSSQQQHKQPPAPRPPTTNTTHNQHLQCSKALTCRSCILKQQVFLCMVPCGRAAALNASPAKGSSHPPPPRARKLNP